MAFARNAGFTSAIATDPADTAAGLLTPARFNLPDVVSGATPGGIPYCPTATSEVTSPNLTWAAATGQGLVMIAGTATTDVNAISITQTWNNVGVIFTAFKQNIVNNNSSSSSLLYDFQVGGASRFKFDINGNWTAIGASSTSAPVMRWSTSNGTTVLYGEFASTQGLISLYSSAGSPGILFTATANAENGRDTGITRTAAGVLGIGTGAAGSFAGSLKLKEAQWGDANGQILTMQSLTELTTIAAAATTDTTITMPAGAVVLGVDVRVTVIIPTAATFTVGDSGSAARFSTAAVAVAAGSTDSGTKAGAYYNAAALAIRITPDLTPAANTGRVRVTIHYYTVTPATS